MPQTLFGRIHMLAIMSLNSEILFSSMSLSYFVRQWPPASLKRINGSSAKRCSECALLVSATSPLHAHT